MQLIEREAKGHAIAQVQNAITRVDENTYSVKSQSNNKDYRVDSTEIGWKCSCPDRFFTPLSSERNRRRFDRA